MDELAPKELEAVGELIAQAFRDNPLNAAVIQSSRPERRLRANRASIGVLLPAALAHGSVWLASEAGAPVAALIATEPGGFPLPPPAGRVRLRSVLAQGIAVAWRWGRAFEQMSALHPPWPHAYLATVGVAPDRQRAGLGSLLVGRWLREVDAKGHAAYLETDRESSLRFYQRLGFRVLGDDDVFGARVWRMHRDACPEGR